MALADAGKTDLAYNSIATETYPSYGYMLNNNHTNATTIWESWFFSDNTFSHCAAKAETSCWMVSR